MNISLEYRNDTHRPILDTFTLPTDQEKYTTLPKDMDDPLPDRIYPIVVVAPKPVGMFLLHDNERVISYTTESNALLFSAFAINYEDQGKGYAKAALQALPQFVKQHFPHIREIVLSVNLKNEAAFCLYMSVGWSDTGRRIGGPIGEQRILFLTI
ncbi:GNAT family N-acetyltransferase [Exiguobacterium sp. MER 193]|uniref:GNAT family N-acetyltransferase n=1 Tax=Exiguobacterium sp. MER 193 TaxID=2939564 RepID=UPI00203BD7F7|nr:GNAT family N-acetyltransferase [Exiguobacterium sp. MER 193]MCM3279968.1 GNAT family N-acetyltransferase [Exiguobacterium sp. MER 193]